MKIRKFASILLAAALLFNLTACGGDGDSSVDGDGSAEGDSSAPASEELPQEEEEARQLPFGLGYYKGLGINPYTCDNAQNQTLTGLVYETLFELDNSFAAQPCLAESVTAELSPVTKTVTVNSEEGDTSQESDETEENEGEADPEEADPGGEEEGDASTSGEGSQAAEKSQTKEVTTYYTNITVTVRSGVSFSDGSKMDVDDVVYSIKLAGASGSLYATRLPGLTEVRTDGKDRVMFTIDGGVTNVAEILDIPIVKEGTGEDLFPIGTGPYVVEKDGTVPTALTANSSWWQLGREYEEEVLDPNQAEDSSANTMLVTRTIQLPVQKINIYPAEDSDGLIFGFSSANITMVSTDLTGYDALQYTGSYTVTDYPTTDLIYLGCNTVKGDCKNQQLRSALYRSLNRKTLVSRLLAGHGEAADMLISPESSLYDQELAEELSYSLATAKELCQEAGGGSLTLLVNDDSTFKIALANEIAKELMAAGVTVEVKTMAWKDYLRAIKKGNFDLYLGEMIINGNFDTSRLTNSDGKMNFTGFASEELDAANLAFNTADAGSRGEKASELSAIIAEQAPVIPICFKNSSILSKDGALLRQMSTQQNPFYHFWDWSIAPEIVGLSN